MRALATCVGIGLVVLLASFARPAAAESLPGANAYEDVAAADLIVVGRVVGEDRVRIEEVLFATDALPEDAREIAVTGLFRHDRRIGLLREPAAEISTSDVVLLLNKGGRPGEWKPLHLFLEADGPRTGGATGTYWVKDGAVWSYDQEMNPGPLVLAPWTQDGKSQGTLAELRVAIARGVEARRAWEADLAIADPAERARRIARWLDPATSPDGSRGRRRKFAVREVLRKQGATAVLALVAATADEHEAEGREIAIETLADLGSTAREAVPRLLEIAAAPGAVRAHAIAYALDHAGDERAIPALSTLLEKASLDDDLVLEYASEGLVRIAGAKAADRIAARLPDSLDSVKVAHGVLSLVEALARVDRTRARAWLSPRAAHPLFRFNAERVRMILGGQ